ncbi:hypothetical protein [Azospirillum thermophilum]|uniref:hypothetical protein n=1 Tax=Azospirillum thermophilum TaxID=2202148 RepID=UPI00143DF8FC|nr:hypothetical protein [Azospirillum thermophilum]
MSQDRQWVILDPANGAEPETLEDKAQEADLPGGPATAVPATAVDADRPAE